MKITPMGSTANMTPPGSESQSSRVESLRSIQMQTNATPSYQQDPRQIPNNSGIITPDQTNAQVEATQPISPQFAALAKQRRALQVKERELLAKEKALSSSSGQSDSIALARLKQEPLNVLLEAGVTYDQLANDLMSNQSNSEINALKAELNAMKTGIDQKFIERETQAKQQALFEIKKEVQILANQGDDFELIRGTGSVMDVMQLIERTYDKTGEVLDIREAMALVEEELFKEAQKIAGLKKMQSHFQSQQAPQMTRHQGMRTLTNKDTASVPSSRQARAMAAFYGTLPK